MLARAQVLLWQREEDGSYQAEKNGWKLLVKWTPQPPAGGEYGYSWTAEGPAGKRASTELLEEAEIAMIKAESAAAGDEPAPGPAGG